ncbi:MAG: helix-turn-helix domain-containing protein [Cyanobacteria bacterium REEB65]|nr:helix-turn-helix domain-containing protein [Cyanobacteria bacterium REEB65]
MSTSEMRPSAVGSKLRDLRRAKGLSLREAARHLGLSHSRLSDFEEGRTHSTGRPANPGAPFLIKAAALYGYPGEALLSLSGLHLSEALAHYQPNASDADAAEILAIYDRLGTSQRRLLLEVARAFDRASI